MTWHPDMPVEYRDAIVTGDARELAAALPDCSVDLVFADPVYDRIEDYEWLAETAARVLKPDSAALVWCGKRTQAACQRALERALEHVYTLDYVVQGKSFMLNTYQLFLWNTPCLLMQKGRCQPRGWIPDCEVIHFGRIAATGTHHKWSKEPMVIGKWLNNFCEPGAVVYDPFTGGGTVPAVAKMLGRSFVAFEIDADTAARARERVALTQAMHPVLLGEQTEMTL